MKQRLFIIVLAIAFSVWSGLQTADAGTFVWWQRLVGKAVLAYLLIACSVWWIKILSTLEQNVHDYDKRDHKSL